MDKTEILELVKTAIGEAIADPVSGVRSIVTSTLAEALAADDVDTVQEADDMDEEDEDEGDEMPPWLAKKMAKGKKGKAVAKEADNATAATKEALDEAKALRFELLLEKKLGESNLINGHRAIVENAFKGRIVEATEIDTMIKQLKEAQAAADPSGHVTENGNGRNGRALEVFDAQDLWAVSYMQKAMGDWEFRNVESSGEDFVKDATPDFYKSWVNNGRPALPRTYRMSEMVRGLLGGDPLLEDFRTTEASTLATITKNTVNIMIAADYSLQQRWYENIVRMHEVDTIDDVTLARLFGVDTLSVVEKGASYAEIPLADEEETAAFVKRGNFVGVPLEDLMKDKLDFFRTIPRRLSDTWYNTLSAQVAGVFTTNAAAGPVLADTGALFNATAATSAGGHANLLTTALSHAAFSAARTAMRKQTNMPLGAGRKVQIEPKFLLVPEDLETTALKIRNSELQPEADMAGTTGNQSVNPFMGKFEVITVPDWTDATDWALVGDPNRFPAIHLIFPRGNKIPQLFTADNETGGSMFTNDTIRYKVRMMTFEFSSTYRVAPVSDFRPLHKNNVAG